MYISREIVDRCRKSTSSKCSSPAVCQFVYTLSRFHHVVHPRATYLLTVYMVHVVKGVRRRNYTIAIKPLLRYIRHMQRLQDVHQTNGHLSTEYSRLFHSLAFTWQMNVARRASKIFHLKYNAVIQLTRF